MKRLVDLDADCSTLNILFGTLKVSRFKKIFIKFLSHFSLSINLDLFHDWVENNNHEDLWRRICSAFDSFGSSATNAGCYFLRLFVPFLTICKHFTFDLYFLLDPFLVVCSIVFYLVLV